MDVQKYYSDFLPMHSKMKTLSCTGIGSGASSTVNLHLTGNRNKQESQVIESYLRVRNQKISGCHSGVEELCRNFKYSSYVHLLQWRAADSGTGSPQLDECFRSNQAWASGQENSRMPHASESRWNTQLSYEPGKGGRLLAYGKR